VTIEAILRAIIREELAAMQHDASDQAPPRLAYSPAEYGHAMGLSASKVYGLIRRGLPVVRIGAQQRIIPADALAWLREHGADESDGADAK